MSKNNQENNALYKEISTFFKKRVNKFDVTDWVLGLDNVYSKILPVNGKSILDYGCGTGRFSRFLRDQGAKIIAVDISQDMLEIAKNNSANTIRYELIKSGQLKFLENNSVDMAVASFVICIMNLERDIIQVFKEIHRVIKVGGKFVFLEGNWEKSNGMEYLSMKYEHVRKLVPGQQYRVTLKAEKPMAVIEHFWPIKSYCKFLEEAGFVVESVDQPLIPKDDFSCSWLSEKVAPPFFIISAVKAK